MAAREAPRHGGRRTLAAQLLDHWYRPQPSMMARALWPLSLVYDVLRRGAQAQQRRAARTAGALPVPVVVVGNLVAGGAGKTPVTIAVVAALRRAGHVPGVVSRGYGGHARGVVEVDDASRAEIVGDEPLLIRRRTGAPVVVARRRIEAARALLAAHPDVSVVVADDGLQHRALPRDAEIVVFDERGAGNGLLLPAGPLREPLTAAPAPQALVLYNAAGPTTPWPGRCVQRTLGDAVPLAAWLAGHGDAAVPLAALACREGREVVAMAGIAAPERFFAMLGAAGLRFTPLALPDHHDYAGAPPWPANAQDVVVTEKDAVKLAAYANAAVRLWVVPLDLRLPDDFVAELLARLPRRHPR